MHKTGAFFEAVPAFWLPTMETVWADTAIATNEIARKKRNDFFMIFLFK